MITAFGVVPASLNHANAGARIGPLPFAMTPLIGRETQVAEIAERLTSPSIRLLTLIGPGGIGKTRLALEAAHAVRDVYEDGAHLLRLASVTDPSLVPVALARALGVRGPTNDHHAWAMARDRPGMVIDNFEHIVAAAPSVVEVLSYCLHVTMLVTSRIPLQVSGEHQYRVPQLETPADDTAIDPATLGRTDAVRLFVERAVAVQPAFRLTLANAATVAQITRQLEGLPLAIELAAARTKHLSAQAILDRLVVTSDDLRGGPVDRSPHQRAIRDTIAWSHDLLDQDLQLVFRRLSIFAGGFLSQAAAYVCGAGDGPPAVQLSDPAQGAEHAILDHCMSLADHNLIFKAEDVRGEPRFSMLLTIRGFGHAELQRLGEWDVVRLRHAAWYLAFAKVAAAAIRGPSQTVWLDWLEVEHANLRAALDCFHQRKDVGASAAMANALSTFWLVRGHLVEGLRWLDTIIAAEGSNAIEQPLRTDLLCAAGWLALRQGLPDVGRAYAEESLATARARGHPVQVAAALRLLGDIEDRVTNYGRARELLHESLGSYREAGDGIGIADTLTGLAGISMDNGDYDEAERVFREAVTAATATGDAIILARAIDSLSVTVHVKGNSTEAITYAERALELYRIHGNVRGIAIAMDHVGKYSRSLGDLVRAWSCHRESLAWRRKVGDPRGMAVWLEAMAGLLASCGALESAACVLGAVDTIRQRGGFPMHNHERAQLKPTLRRVSDHLPPEHFARSWARGSLMSLTEIVDLAYDEADRAVAVRGRREGHEQAHPPTTVDELAGRGLTSRQRDVARLLALRLSDKEIAERLSISPRTVSTHVAAIRAKLDVHSRRDAARFAGEPKQDHPGDDDRSAPSPT